MRLLTWNIQWGRGRDGRVDLARVAATIAGHGADLVCLQEVAVNHPGLPGAPAGDQTAHLQALLTGYTAAYAVGSDLPDGHGGRRCFGNLILSRRPLLQVFRHLLPWPADPAVPSMQRVALEAVVDAPGGPLRVLTSHLEFYSPSQRAAQVEALRTLQAEGHGHACHPAAAGDDDPPFAVLPRGQATVICGDFNFAPGSAEYARLQAPFDDDVPTLCDAWQALHPAQPQPPTAGLVTTPWLAAPGCYDYFFVSANLLPRLGEMRVDDGADGSDHQPVALTLV
ncbi:MAG TPA: endonuclease/exonuclease/phosphatase family protein [Rhodocyclaceae bacterium]